MQCLTLLLTIREVCSYWWHGWWGFNYWDFLKNCWDKSCGEWFKCGWSCFSTEGWTWEVPVFWGSPAELSPVPQVMDSLEVKDQANHAEIISSQISLQGPVWHRICRMTADYSARTKAGPHSREFNLILMSFAKLLMNNSTLKKKRKSSWPIK